MHLLVENQPLSTFEMRASHGLDWVDAYDMLERSWPYSRTRRNSPQLIQIAARVAKRRQDRPLPPRQAFQSTAAYYEAVLPAIIARSYWERVADWRYVRPMMIRLILGRWPIRRRC